MGDISKKVKISAPVDAVFRYVSDPCNTPHYISSIISVDSGSHAQPQEGQVWRAEANFMGKRRSINLRIQQLRPNHLVRFSINSEPPANLTMTLTPNGDSSTEAELQVDVPGVPGLLLNGVMGGMLQSDMARLKRVLET